MIPLAIELLGLLAKEGDLGKAKVGARAKAEERRKRGMEEDE